MSESERTAKAATIYKFWADQAYCFDTSEDATPHEGLEELLREEQQRVYAYYDFVHTRGKGHLNLGEALQRMRRIRASISYMTQQLPVTHPGTPVPTKPPPRPAKKYRGQ